MAQHAKTAYLNVRDRELSNARWLVEFRRRKVVVHTLVTTLLAQRRFLVEFSPWESCSFSILRAILLKLHIFAQLIESYPTVSGWSSCIKKRSIPQAAHTIVTMYACREMSFFALSKALILQSYVLSC